MTTKETLDTDNIPNHIAIIMDGNGRWAKKQGQLRTFGHTNAVTAVKDVIEASAELNVKTLTLYAFSTENWGRPKEEIDLLMQLLVDTIHQEKENLQKNNIRLEAIGNLDDLPEHCAKQLRSTIAETASNNKMTVVIALNYSGRWDISNAMKLIAADIELNKIKKEDISEELISNYLSTSNYQDPDLLIRTSGELRISNFLLWQLAYSEIYVTDILWPDFRKGNLYEAIANYQKRERRFGKISEQLLP